MIVKARLLFFLTTVLLAVGPAYPQTAANQPISMVGNHFVRDGKPYQILSGSIHYPRVPREYWRDRLKKARALGLNTVETYAFWNLHEPQPGVFDFSGNLDIAAFVRMAQEEDLNVIVRPGPYICAEWEAGGLPAWLFADPSLKVRTKDPKFLAAVDRYFARLGRELAPLQAAHGGPIIALQIENEYGSFGDDREYMEDIHQSLIRAGLGDSIFFTSDGPEQMPKDALPGILSVVNFGPGDAQKSFALVKQYRPDEPMMTGEYWDGWFDEWGGEHAHTDAAQQAGDVDWMLSQRYSFNLYMFHGGTTFGFMNGANLKDDPNGHYAPQVTSYDYDAALDEAGRPTRKFYLFRDVIQRHTGVAPPPLPPALPIAQVPAFTLTESASLWSNLPAPIASEQPRSMENFGQAYGYILYRTHLSGPQDGQLVLNDLRDYAAVYLDHNLAGTLDRRLKQTSLAIQVPAGGATLDLLVENTGRVNYGPHLQDGRAGITDSVSLGGHPLTGWEIYPLPMTTPDALTGWKAEAVAGPAFHRGSFSLETATDTYLETSKLGKGFVWINGHNLGRTWNIGPQQSLFVPAPWLKKGENDVIVFDYTSLDKPVLRGVTDPIWSAPAKQSKP